MHKKYTSILSKLLGHTSKLVRIDNAVLDSIQLELSSNYLLNEFTKYVKENNRFGGLGNIISGFTWLEYNDRN